MWSVYWFVALVLNGKCKNRPANPGHPPGGAQPHYRCNPSLPSATGTIPSKFESVFWLLFRVLSFLITPSGLPLSVLIDCPMPVPGMGVARAVITNTTKTKNGIEYFIEKSRGDAKIMDG